MSQTSALFLDSYRELNSRKLFWITIGLSGVVVLIFLGLGFNDAGISVFGYQWDMRFNATILNKSLFYRLLFFKLGVDYWLTWVATILALVSTAGIFPDLLTSGSIDLYLSKPISRARLFLTKYFAGLLFVALQVAVFSAGSFVVLKIRGGIWYPGVFLAVPTVLIFYSYLYCACVLIGVVTRSSIAAILLTLLFWFAILGVHFVETATLKEQMLDQIHAERSDRQLARQEAEVRAASPADIAGASDRLKELREKRRDSDSAAARHARIHQKFFAAATLLPKTSETVELMSRWLIEASETKASRAELERLNDDDAPQPFMFGLTTDDMRAQQRMEKAIRARPVGWVIGSSLVFEAVIVSLAGWIFCRRDY